MDYIVASTLRLRNEWTPLIASYDIACQWLVHFHERVGTFPSHIQIDLPTPDSGELHYAIPKYHFRAHKEAGHNRYSLHLMHGVGRICGKQIERTWPKHSETAGSTQEMGPGSRQDTLEDHFSYTNWRVLVTLGTSLLCPRNVYCDLTARQVLCFNVSIERPSRRALTRKRSWPSSLRSWNQKTLESGSHRQTHMRQTRLCQIHITARPSVRLFLLVVSFQTDEPSQD